MVVRGHTHFVAKHHLLDLAVHLDALGRIGLAAGGLGQFVGLRARARGRFSLSVQWNTS